MTTEKLNEAKNKVNLGQSTANNNNNNGQPANP